MAQRIDQRIRPLSCKPVSSRGQIGFNSRFADLLGQTLQLLYPLGQVIELSFASPEIQQRVRDMQEESAIVLSNESRERALVGEVISTVALAGQLCREFNVSDKGIDMEIEFNDDANEATGQKLYLQLKSGDSYLRERKGDGAEIFKIRDERHARYWMMQKFPVLLVIRTSEGEVRWMRIDDYLKRQSNNGKKPVKQIFFKGAPFNVMAVRCWRDWALGQDSPPRPSGLGPPRA
ncbi:MAG: DUF4365 domain-containing protein [Phycisphaerae bacterium]|nr:DUF4365 domain-containing protein [Phycisphaerae bacterium]